MSGRKNVLVPYKIIDSEVMHADITSAVTAIQFLDNISMQINWTSSPTGTFDVQGSLDYEIDYVGNVVHAGHWASLGLSPSISGGSPILLDLNQLSFPYVRLVFTDTFIESGTVTTVADVASSLNSKYFLLNGADGVNYYIWINVAGAGVDPMVASRTGVPVAIAANASANTVAAAVEAAMSALASVGTSSVLANAVSFNQSVAGHGALADSVPAPTGFAFAYTQVTAVLDAYVSGKQV